MIGIDNSIKPLSRRLIGLLPLILDLRGRSSPAATYAFVPPPSSSSSSSSNGNRESRLRAAAADAPSATTRTSSSTSIHSPPPSPRNLVREGMRSFRMGDVASSLSYFDAAEEAASSSSGSGSGSSSLAPYLWQRGISYYYLDRFEDGHVQFRRDVAVNPNDVEEIVWDVACLARMMTTTATTTSKDDTAAGGGGGGKYPPDGIMALPQGKKDSRKIMSTVYSLFRGDGATEWDLRKAGHEAGNASDEFYSLFYLGL